MPSLVTAVEQQALNSQRSSREDEKEQERRRKFDQLQQSTAATPVAPLNMRNIATLNEATILSAKKLTDRNAIDQEEEERIKRATPRRRGVGADSPMPSPRKALFLAPSPRRLAEDKQQLLNGQGASSENLGSENNELDMGA